MYLESGKKIWIQSIYLELGKKHASNKSYLGSEKKKLSDDFICALASEFTLKENVYESCS